MPFPLAVDLGTTPGELVPGQLLLYSDLRHVTNAVIKTMEQLYSHRKDKYHGSRKRKTWGKRGEIWASEWALQTRTKSDEMTGSGLRLQASELALNRLGKSPWYIWNSYNVYLSLPFGKCHHYGVDLSWQRTLPQLVIGWIPSCLLQSEGSPSNDL